MSRRRLLLANGPFPISIITDNPYGDIRQYIPSTHSPIYKLIRYCFNVWDSEGYDYNITVQYSQFVIDQEQGTGGEIGYAIGIQSIYYDDGIKISGVDESETEWTGGIDATTGKLIICKLQIKQLLPIRLYEGYNENAGEIIDYARRILYPIGEDTGYPNVRNVYFTSNTQIFDPKRTLWLNDIYYSTGFQVRLSNAINGDEYALFGIGAADRLYKISDNTKADDILTWRLNTDGYLYITYN
jgi:hypothetical protein